MEQVEHLVHLESMVLQDLVVLVVLQGQVELRELMGLVELQG